MGLKNRLSRCRCLLDLIRSCLLRPNADKRQPVCQTWAEPKPKALWVLLRGPSLTATRTAEESSLLACRLLAHAVFGKQLSFFNRIFHPPLRHQRFHQLINSRAYAKRFPNIAAEAYVTASAPALSVQKQDDLPIHLPSQNGTSIHIPARTEAALQTLSARSPRHERPPLDGQ